MLSFNDRSVLVQYVNGFVIKNFKIDTYYPGKKGRVHLFNDFYDLSDILHFIVDTKSSGKYIDALNYCISTMDYYITANKGVPPEVVRAFVKLLLTVNLFYEAYNLMWFLKKELSDTENLIEEAKVSLFEANCTVNELEEASKKAHAGNYDIAIDLAKRYSGNRSYSLVSFEDMKTGLARIYSEL